MSPDIFPKYLKDPSLLYRISYEELKTLVVQYPYCQNLRYLLLVKSKMDGNIEQDRNMKMVSAYSQDRTQLYLLLREDLQVAQKEFEFLDLEHAVTDEENPELELPILDFSKGISVKDEKEAAKAKFQSVKLNQNVEKETVSDDDEKPKENIPLINEEKDLLSLFDEDEEEEPADPKPKEANTITTPSIPLVATGILAVNEIIQEEKQEKPQPLSLDFLAIPPLVHWEESISIREDESKNVEAVSEPLAYPIVPPIPHIISIEILEDESDDIHIPIPPTVHFIDKEVSATSSSEVEAFIHEILEEKVSESFQYPIIPPSIEWLHQIEEVPEDTIQPILETAPSDFAQEIDDSIQAALARLAEEQKIELEQEEKEEEAKIMAIIKEEIRLEDGPEEKTEVPPGAPEPSPPTQTHGPMPKDSFSSWLQNMKAPNPEDDIVLNESPDESSEKEKDSDTEKNSTSLDELIEIKKKKKAKKKKRKKGKKEKKAKAKSKEKEGDRLMKVIKMKKSAKKKEKAQMLLVRKKKVMELAEQSLKENEEIISETLAKILVIQGKKNRAERMYRKLMLKFPKKSSFFAAEIDKIHKSN